MIAAARVVGWALAGLYSETFPLLKANLTWFLISLPLGLPPLLLLTAALPPQVGGPENDILALPLMATGLFLLLVPNPAALGLFRLAAVIDGQQAPSWRQFWDATRQNVRLGLALYLIGLLGTVVLVVNILFYLRQDQTPLQAISVVWLYSLLFWSGLHVYLGPLVVLLGERRVPALYRRAAALVVAHPIYTLGFLLTMALLMLLCLLAFPAYALLAMAFVALVSTRALSVLKRKYDPSHGADEEPV